MGKLFDLEEEGYFYSRLQNPTNDVVAQKICDLEGGVAAMLTSSGQAATMLAVTNICEAGDHVVCAAKVYGGTSNLLAVTLKRFGIETTLVDQDAPAEELEKAFQPNTKAVFAETISNPAGVVLDIDKFVKLAHEHGVPMICDNTFATPINCRPVRVRCRYCHPFHHKIHGRPCNGARRSDCRFRKLRLGCACRQIPGPYYTGRIVPRRDLYAEIR